MNNGRWAGSYDEQVQPYSEVEWGDARWHHPDVTMKTNEKVPIPEFSGEGSEQEVGKSARSYVRKVQVWLRCTRMPPSQRALALYNALSDRAWAYAEELDMDILASESGVSYYLEWIQTRFMEVEMTKISGMMNDLFRKCKKRQEQSVREFNVEFERMVLRLREVQCELPPLVKAWLYVDKLRLSENEELALLASVGNEYDVRKLQQAAMIQDRSLRHGAGGQDGASRPRWQKFSKQSVHMTTNEEELTSEDEPNDHDDHDQELVEESVAEAAHTAYLAYQGAKAKYKEAMKGRGVDLEEVRRRNEEKLKQAKARSFCSACKRRGHWHRDAECPLRDVKKDGNRPASPTQQVNMVQNVHSSCVANHADRVLATEFDMMAILDTACTKSVAGYPWFERYYKMADSLGIPWHVVDEVDHFQFGASKVFQSTFAIRGWFAIFGKWFMVKVAIVPCAVPLLFSRPVLSQLGTQYDMAAQKVSIRSLGLEDLDIQTSNSGHPALFVAQFPEGAPPSGDEPLAFEDVWAPESVYMAAAVGGVSSVMTTSTCSVPMVFYPKKIPLEVQNMLSTSSTVSAAAFFSWWSHANQRKDFWIETENEMIRIHVVPRTSPFNPTLWKTSQSDLKDALLSRLAGPCITEVIPVLGDGVVSHVHHGHLDDDKFAWKQQLGLWIGRSRFTRLEVHPSASTTISNSFTALHAGCRDPEVTMEDEQGRTHGGAQSPGHGHARLLVGPRAQELGVRSPAGDGDEVQSRSGAQGGHQAESGRIDSPGSQHAHSDSREADQRMAHPDVEGCHSHTSGHHRPVRQVQGVALSGNSRSLLGMDGEGDQRQPKCSSRSGAIGNLGQSGIGATVQQSEDRLCPREDARPGDQCNDPTSDRGRDASWFGKLRFLLGKSQCSVHSKAEAQEDTSTPRDGFRCGGGRRGSNRDRRDQDARDASGRAQGQAQSECPHGPARSGLKPPHFTLESEEGNCSHSSEIEYDIGTCSLGTEVEPKDVTCSQAYVTKNVGSNFSKSEDGDFSEFEDGMEEYQLGGSESEDDGVRFMTNRQKARRGIAARKRMNRSTAQKLKANMVMMCTVMMSCLGATASFVHETCEGPVNDVLAIFTPSAQLMPGHQREVDCLELFAGRARISEAFAKKRRGVLCPRDLLMGHDFRRREVQQEILSDIHEHRPGMVWLAPPCTLWGNFSHLNYDKQTLRRLRRKEMDLIKFADEVMDLQVALGGQFVLENPRGSDLWRTPTLQSWISPQRAHLAKVDLCSYGMRSIGDDFPLLKPISLLCSDEMFAHNIAQLCAGDHEHLPIQGKNTAHSAVYPTAFANAVVRAYSKSQTFVAFPTAAASASKDSGGYILDGEEVPDESYGAKAISFRGKVNPTIASTLKRIHQNLGHPPNRELVRHLKIGGAPKPVIHTAEQMVCRVCERSSRAKPHKVSAPVTSLDFNEVVAADILWVDTADRKNLPALNIVDLASTYQVVIPLPGTKSEDVSQAFSSGWIQWAGIPKQVLIDLDSAFKDKFLALMDEKCIIVRSAAGQAHWQNGVCERHGGSWKAIYAKLLEENLILEEEFTEACAAVSDAKNSLRNRSGFSPRQWVFGSNGRQVGDLFDGSDDTASFPAGSPDAKFARAQVVRTGARAAFFQCQTKDALQRAIHHKPRQQPEHYEVGDMVYIYREYRQGKGKKPSAAWMGPAVVIGKQDPNYWLARGGRCLLAAPEHLRPADPEEVSETIRIKLAMKSMMTTTSHPTWKWMGGETFSNLPTPSLRAPIWRWKILFKEEFQVLRTGFGPMWHHERSRSRAPFERPKHLMTCPFASRNQGLSLW
jgi:hypothetical protein